MHQKISCIKLIILKCVVHSINNDIIIMITEQTIHTVRFNNHIYIKTKPNPNAYIKCTKLFLTKKKR